MKIIAGLGNPGSRFAGTRHNVGFSVIDEMAETYNIPLNNKGFKAVYGTGRIGGERVILAMPQTFMNLSGESVRALMNFYKCTPEDLIVIYDDIYLDVGKLRIRAKGSAGGHNGMKNIIQNIGSENFVRVRVGVGEKPPKMDLADYVLSRFLNEELQDIRQGCTNACEAVGLIIEDDISTAMNRFN
jgi:PTH1 family peptidyl-tRNA hydrolase